MPYYWEKHLFGSCGIPWCGGAYPVGDDRHERSDRFQVHINLTAHQNNQWLYWLNDFVAHAPIVIEDNVWIGAAATVTPGVTIGRGRLSGRAP